METTIWLVIIAFFIYAGIAYNSGRLNREAANSKEETNNE